MMHYMTTKQTSPSPGKRRAAPVSGRVARAKPARVMPVFKLSVDVGPVVSIVRRHVKLSKKADAAITSELAEMLNNVFVELQATGHEATAQQAASNREDDQVLTTEQAAQLAGVSRPYMAKLIDTGAVALHQMVGNQRRVLRSAVTRWQAAERTRQAKALKRLAEDLDEEIFSS